MVQVIPVLDILGGRVVHAVAGDRRRYQPLASPLIDGPTTAAGLTRLFVQDWGLEQIYLADLDAIAGETPHWRDYAELLDLGARLWIDAGVRTVNEARVLARFQSPSGRMIERVIVGLESVPTESRLVEMVTEVGIERAVFSLDMDDGRLRTSVSAWRELSPRELVRQVRQAGFRQIILLDLRRVGTATGTGTSELLKDLAAEFDDVTWIAGGGVRGPQDLVTLRRAGCDAVLVASALHRAQLGQADVRVELARE